MIHFRFCVAALLLATPAFAQTNPVMDPVLPARVRNSFNLLIHASYRDTAALFGPVGERLWGGQEWDPHFLYPVPEQDVEGAVFSVQHGVHKSVWVNSVRDLEARHFQYVYFIPDVLVTTIDVHFTPADNAATKVEVIYTRTAINPDANSHVRAMGEADRTSGPDWQRSIDRYLSGAKTR